MAVPRRSFLLALPLGVVAACNRVRQSAQNTTRRSTSTVARDTSSTARPPDGRPAEFISSGPQKSASIALTFHGNGDVALLHNLLATARRVRAPITIFAVGAWLDANPELAPLVQHEGHELANHTYTHPTLPRLSRPGVASEITRCRDALTRHAGSPGLWFRPSGTPTPTAMMLEEAGKAGYRHVIGYDIDPHDYQDPGPAAVVARVSAALHPGAIVSLHTGHEGTVAAFDQIVAAVRAKNLAPVLLRDLLAPIAR